MEKMTKTITDKIRLSAEEKETLEKAKVILDEIVDVMGYDCLDLVGHTLINYVSLNETIETLKDLIEEEEYFTFEE